MPRQKRPATLDFIVVARTGSGPYPHPVEVAVYPDGAESLLTFSIGPHIVNAGGIVHLGTVLDEERGGLSPSFATEFEAADLAWLVPFLVRLWSGEDVRAAIVAAYRARHGKAPQTMAVGRPSQ